LKSFNHIRPRISYQTVKRYPISWFWSCTLGPCYTNACRIRLLL